LLWLSLTLVSPRARAEKVVNQGCVMTHTLMGWELC